MLFLFQKQPQPSIISYQISSSPRGNVKPTKKIIKKNCLHRDHADLLCIVPIFYPKLLLYPLCPTPLQLRQLGYGMDRVEGRINNA
jgi:hypothetical protein